MTLTTLALHNDKKSAGSKYIQKGFCFAEEDDFLFALGYPYLVFLDDEAQKITKPYQACSDFMKNHGIDKGIWPREIAKRMLRGWGKWSDKKAFDTMKEISPQEAESLVQYAVARGYEDTFAYVLEAFVGPEPVAEAIMMLLEQFPKVKSKADISFIVKSLKNFIFALGFIFLRLPESKVKGYQGRLEKLLKKWGSLKYPLDSLKAPVDIILHGRKGAENSGYRYDKVHLAADSLLYVQDDSLWVLKTLIECGAPEAGSFPNARLSFLAGEKYLEMESGWFKKYTVQGAKNILFEQFSRIRSPHVVSLMLNLSSSTDVKKAVAKWFVDHAIFAKPHLVKLVKSKSPEAAPAQKILESLS